MLVNGTLSSLEFWFLVVYIPSKSWRKKFDPKVSGKARPNICYQSTRQPSLTYSGTTRLEFRF